MKKCTTCNHLVDAPGNFCPNCGNKTLVEFQQPVQNQSTTPEHPNYANRQMHTAHAVQSPYMAPQAPMGAAPAAKKSPNSKALIGIIGGLAAVVIAVVAIVLVTTLSNGPVVKLYSGILEVFTSGDTYDVDITYKADGDKGNFNGQLAVDVAGQKAYLDVIETADDGKSSAIGYISMEDELFVLDAEDSSEKFGIINDIIYEDDFVGDYKDEYDYIMSIAEFIFEVLPLADNPAKLDSEKISDLAKDAFDMNDAAADILAESYPVLAPDVFKKLSSKSWAKENLGYESSGGLLPTHSFEFNLDAPISEFITVVEENQDALQEVFDAYDVDVDDFIDELEYLEEDLEDYTVELHVTYSGKFVSSIDFTISDDYDNEFSINVTVEKADKALTVNADDYNERYDELKEKYEESEYDYSYDYEDLYNDYYDYYNDYYNNYYDYY